MDLAFQFRFWVQVQCFRPCDRDQNALTQVHHPCHLTNSTNWVHLVANNSSSAFASDVKINTALLNFGNGEGCVILPHEVVSILPHEAVLPHEAK